MPFDVLTPADDDTLHWRQPAATEWRFVLAAGDREFAELTMEAWSGAKARATTASGAWHFESAGFWKPRVVVRAEDAVVATFEIANAWTMRAADLVAADDRRIARWQMTSFLRGEVEWTDGDGARLIRYRIGTDEGGMASWLRTQCRVDFTPAGFGHPDRDLLLCLGWYFTALAANPAV